MTSLEKILFSHWGYSSFRPLQKEIITSVLEKKDTLALLPTGGGKSICYQLPALIQDGFCLVVSPLVALMQDQVRRAEELSINTASIHAAMHFKDVKRTLENAVHGAYKLLYVSPERLQSNFFREYLPAFNLNLIAVDEAHCISQWGHDFRPDYLKIASLKKEFRDVPILALTATATQDVQQDIIKQLELKDACVFKQSFRRDNIFYDLRYSERKTEDAINSIREGNGSSIIYCRSRKQTEVLTRQLKDLGITALCYHAGMTAAKRAEAQQLWIDDKVKTMVATSAFGMGIDKADVRTVIHYEAPECPEAYYQEAGRAGRDGHSSKAIVLFNHKDITRLQESTALQFPSTEFLRQVYQSVCEYLQIPIGAAPDKYFDFDISDFCSRFNLPVLAASNALRLLEREGLWTFSEAAFQPASIYFTSNRNELDQLANLYPELSLITTNLLRLYGTLFYHPTPVRLQAIARQTRLKQETIHQYLLQLDKMELIEYRPTKEGAQLYFHHLRADSRHLIIDVQRINVLKKKHEARIRTMTDFLLGQHTCRERYLLHFFGENAQEDCKHCNVCTKKYFIASPLQGLQEKVLIHLKNPRSLQEITKLFPEGEKERIIQILRTLWDEGKVSRTVDGLFFSDQLPTN